MSQVQFVVRRQDDDNELMHYGVPGMKWGVRRAASAYANATTSEGRKKAQAKIDKHYAKASNKLNKYVTKAEKSLAKARKQTMKADRRWYNSDAHRDMAARHSRKAGRKMYKAQKWVKHMEKTFNKTTTKVSKEQIDIGKRYADMLNNRALNASY